MNDTASQKFSHDFQHDLATAKFSTANNLQYMYCTSMLTFLTITFVVIPLMPRACAAVVPIVTVLPTYKISSFPIKIIFLIFYI